MQQEQKLSPQMLQYMKILQMNTQELQGYLNELYQENPAMELEESAREEPAQEEPFRQMREKLTWLEQNDSQNMGYRQSGEEEYDSLANYPDEDHSEGLEAHLLSQLGQLPAQLDQAVELIIDSLAPSGWLGCSLEQLARETGTEPELLEQALGIVQGLEPRGVGARNLEECLLIQLKAGGQDTALACEIVRHYLNALSKSRYGLIARATGESMDAVRSACRVIRGLNPKPGRGFETGESTTYIVPDIVTAKFEDHFELILNDRHLPKITVNRYYLSLMNTTEDREVKEYLMDKVHQVQWVARSVEQRRNTLLSCAQVILELQEAFFRKGPGNLAPMTLEDVANRLKIHESTVSRAIRGKYIQCSNGIYLLSSFFSRGLPGETRTDKGASPDFVKSLLRRLVAEEDPEAPKSDRELCRELEREGCHISRRTVAKYRTELGIPSSAGRRKQP